MKTQYLVLVRKQFNSSDVPRRVNRHNQRSWVKSVRFLGDKWKLSKVNHVQRKEGEAS